MLQELGGVKVSGDSLVKMFIELEKLLKQPWNLSTHFDASIFWTIGEEDISLDQLKHKNAL